MLPRSNSIKQMKKIRKIIKNDIGDNTIKSSNKPNLINICNPFDHHIDTYEEFSNDKIQTVASKSKIVNKNKNENNNINMNKTLNFEDFLNENIDDIEDLEDLINAGGESDSNNRKTIYYTRTKKTEKVI